MVLLEAAAVPIESLALAEYETVGRPGREVSASASTPPGTSTGGTGMIDFRLEGGSVSRTGRGRVLASGALVLILSI